MKENIIGRQAEKKLLEEVVQSTKSEFVAITGRRRVGKTFLVKEYFENCLTFQTAGMSNENTSHQLKAFYQDLLGSGLHNDSVAPKDWIEAFALLRQLLESSPAKRKIVFLDELPWMDTPRSGFVAALEHFWNVWASARHDIVLIVCGSATSWMMDKLINNHGGLHNRITRSIFLQPLTLGESEAFLLRKGFMLSRYEEAVCYMVFGGIPYYLDLLEPGLTLTENIDGLLFRREGMLRHEFRNLYAALFKNSDDYIAVVKALSKKGYGMTRDEIIRYTGIGSNGGLTKVLRNLEYCGFIRSYDVFKGKRGESIIYQLVDFYTLFYFMFLQNSKTATGHYWASLQGKPQFYTWAGLTFELLCLTHIAQIKSALGISGIETLEYAWRDNSINGAQVDMVIERADPTINICEMKFSQNEYEITAEYERKLRDKLSAFSSLVKRKKSLQLTMITTYGVKRNTHSGIVAKSIVLDQLFT